MRGSYSLLVDAEAELLVSEETRNNNFSRNI